MIEHFEPGVTARDLQDLRERLAATRWPEPATDAAQGVDLARLHELCEYWRDGYDWRRCDSRLAEIGRFRAVIDGLGICFVHARSPSPNAFPLVLTHGWPGSVIEFLDALGPLTDAGFDCVVPSLPGYGWSDKPRQPGWGVERIARAWIELMAQLGYDRYGAVGSDWGTSISASIVQQDPTHAAGALLLPPLAPPLPDSGSFERPDDSGYSTQQRTRPQTIGYALTDSPAGLAAWIVEKLDTWTDPRSTLEVDSVLDNLMHYWLPATGASAARLYWESLNDVTRWLTGPLEPRDLIHASVGCSIFPHELQRPTRIEAEQRFTDIRYWAEPDIGGHFAAWEQPAVFAREVDSFFRLLR